MSNTPSRNSFDAWIRDQGPSGSSRSGNAHPVHNAAGEYPPIGPQHPPSSYSGATDLDLIFGNQFSPGYDTDKTTPPLLQVDIPSGFSPCTPSGQDPYLQAQFRTPGLSPESRFTRTPSSVLVTPNSGNFNFSATAASPLQSPPYSSSTGISPLVGRLNITEKWRSSYPFSPTSRLQQAGDHYPITQSGQVPLPQLGLYQATEQPNILENLSEFSSLHQFPPESQRHDLQPALVFPPESTAGDGVTGGGFPGASSGVSQTTEEVQYDHNQYYIYHSASSREMFANPQPEWPSSSINHTTSAANPNITSALSGGAPQEHGPDFLGWHGYTGYSPSGSGYSGTVAPPTKLEGEICDSLQSPLAGPSSSVARARRGRDRDCENPEGIIRKRGGASIALRGAADRKRKRPRKYGCTYCGDSFTSRQNLQNHLNSHYQRNPYPCKHCPKVYRHSRSLNRHLNKAHHIQTDGRRRKGE